MVKFFPDAEIHLTAINLTIAQHLCVLSIE